MILLSLIQVLIAKRAYTVNEALINTLSDFENKNNFSLLKDFNTQTEKLNRKSRMNFPSFAMIALFFLFFLMWLIVLLITLYSIILPPGHSFMGGHSQMLIYVYAMLYAVTMKISDMLDEHGLRLFKGASYFFSLICAIFGCLLIVSNTVIANVVFAMIIGFVIRKRIDYNNHILAFIIISSCFLIRSSIIIEIYFPFLCAITLLGFLKDTKYKSNKSQLIVAINKVFLYVPIIYVLPSLFYSIISNEWCIFFTFFIYDFSYNVTRLIGEYIMQTKSSIVVSGDHTNASSE